MGPGTYFNLCFCLLGFVVSGTPVEEEEPTHQPLVESRDAASPNVSLIFLAEKGCHKGWHRRSHQPDNTCYRCIDCLKTFEEAEAECQSYGDNVHLLSIHDEEERDWIISKVIPRTIKQNIWIGLRNLNQNCHAWEWTDKSKFSYQPWQDGRNTLCDGSQACVQMTQTSRYGEWDDTECDVTAPYICRYEL